MLRDKTKTILREVDNMVADVFRVSGTNILDAIGGMDEEDAAMAIPVCRIYRDLKEYLLEMSDMMDHQERMMRELCRMNEKLLKQNDVLIDKIEKMEQENTCKCH